MPFFFDLTKNYFIPAILLRTMDKNPLLIPDSKPTSPQSLGTGALHELPRLIERMHRRFLDVVRLELEKLGVRDISPVQVMMMSNIGVEEISVRDLIERGYYLGSNASYNLKQLVECAYVARAASSRDRRSARLRVTPKGRAVLNKLNALETLWAEPLLRHGDQSAIDTTWKTLRQLERCWTDTVRYTEPEDDNSF